MNIIKKSSGVIVVSTIILSFLLSLFSIGFLTRPVNAESGEATIIYDANGGYFTCNPDGTPGEPVIVSQTEPIGSSISLLDYNRHAYNFVRLNIENHDATMQFVGWSENKDYKFHFDYNDESLYAGGYVVEGDKTLYAIWSPRVDITFDANGCTFEDGSTVKKLSRVAGDMFELPTLNTASTTTVRFDRDTAMIDGKLVQQPQPRAIYKDMFFLGWSTQKDDLTGEYIVTHIPDSETTLYAVWGKPVNITFDGNGFDLAGKSVVDGVGHMMHAAGVKMGDTYIYLAYKKGGKYPDDCVEVKWALDKEGKNIIPDMKEFIPEEDITLYAIAADDIETPDLVQIPSKPATCTEEGFETYWKSSSTNKMFSDESGTIEIEAPVAIPALGHAWGEWKTVKEATEKEDGLKERVCSRDSSHKETEVIPANAHTHTLVKTEAVAATCEKDGNIAYWTCSGCKKIFSDAAGTKEIKKTATVQKALGHNWGEWKTVKEATEKEEGLKERVCSRNSSHKETEVIPAKAHTHTLVKTEAVAATCEKDGNIAYWTCSGCGKIFSDAAGTKEVAKEATVQKALGHNWGEWKTVEEATTAKEGLEERVCSRDASHKQTRSIPKQNIPDQNKKEGWRYENNGWYYYKNNATQKGWLYDGAWYYLNPGTGTMRTGWLYDGGNWYYLNGSGAMVTGWQKINNVWYYLKTNGAMAANEWCEGYWLNGDGSWTYPYYGQWHLDNVGWWFGDNSGWYARNGVSRISGVDYRFNASGYWVQ